MTEKDQILKEIEIDRKHFFSEDSSLLFLSEDSDKKENSNDDKEESKLDILGKIKEFISVLKSSSEFSDEEHIDEECNALENACKFLCKYAFCSILVGPIIGAMAAIIWKKLSDKASIGDKKKIFTKLASNYRVIDAKLNDLEKIDSLSDDQKKQKYALIKMKEQTRLNMIKLRDNVQKRIEEEEDD